MLHIDLFSGIGGFAIAAEKVWPDIKHIFVDNDPFCQKVLAKHWSEAPIFGDIRTFTPNTPSKRLRGGGEDGTEQQASLSWKNIQKNERTFIADPRSEKYRGLSSGERKAISSARKSGVFILTGGFPCQPFSQAGRRKGTADDRFLWPEMARVIAEFRPRWVIAENVRGLVNIQGGVVFEQVCADLEGLGYAVQPLVIPAVAVNAPHRRDRIWFVAYCAGIGLVARGGDGKGGHILRDEERNATKDKQTGHRRKCGIGEVRVIQDAKYDGSGIRKDEKQGNIGNEWNISTGNATRVFGKENWNQNWLEVATRLCGVSYGFSAKLDGRMTPAKHRIERLKSLGNAIVPQVAEEIMKAIKQSHA